MWSTWRDTGTTSDIAFPGPAHQRVGPIQAACFSFPFSCERLGFARRLWRMPCEVVEAAHVEDADAYPCLGQAHRKCSDCGAQVCEFHAQDCTHCADVF